MKRRAWWRRVLDLVSQAGNVILLNGEPDEPISARA